MATTYVIADLHGRYDLLLKALREIEAGATSGTVVFLGDYIDRGPDSRHVLNVLMAGPPAGWKWVCLKGNHEDMMVETIRQQLEPDWWIGNGGGATVLSFYNGAGKSDVGMIPEAHLEWCAALPKMHRDQHRIYVHAGVDPTIAIDEQTEATLLWSRLPKHWDIRHPDGHVVHGHTPHDDGPILLPGRTNLDTGAYFTNRLAVAVFNDAAPGGPVRIIRIDATPARPDREVAP